MKQTVSLDSLHFIKINSRRLCVCRGRACVWGGGGEVFDKYKKKYILYIRLSIYNDGVRPMEMKRRLEVEEKLV